MHWFALLLSFAFVILCIMIILVILMQPGQSEGLAGTFGSGGMLGSAFGVHIKNRLAKFTTILVVVFFAIIFTFALAFRGGEEETPFGESPLDHAPARKEEKGGTGETGRAAPGKEGEHEKEVKTPAPAAEKKDSSPAGEKAGEKKGTE